MIIYTMGFTKKNAKEFFEKVRHNEIDILVDVRLNNSSQLAGFAKGRDLEFFLERLCQCDYKHMLAYAPTKEILDGYKKGKISWEEYAGEYNALIERRKVEETFQNNFKQYERVLLLCSESTPENCHRRLLAEYLAEKLQVEIKHI